MKSDLTKESLKNMYGGSSKKKIKTETKNVTAKSSREMVVIESNGQQHIVPTHTAFVEMMREHKSMKNELKKAQGDLKLLKDAFNNLVGFTNTLRESLDDKIDKPDSHD